ncbi:MAG: Na+-transporting NADH:ubiquinone oxidoreductase subunit A [Parasphingorhabdus sp.]|jgi:Na+-transporting NADH:ubiquinone oxidoreductase subunit A
MENKAVMTIPEPTPVSRVALLGEDFPGARFEILVQPGSNVAKGEAVLRHRKHPKIVFPSALGGRVTAIQRGPRRSLVSLQIEGEDETRPAEIEIPRSPDAESIKQLLLSSGMWSSLRTRPFGHIPTPDHEPAALLITAIDTWPLAADPAVIINAFADDFTCGIETLGAMLACPIYLCHKPNANLPTSDTKQCQSVEFSGPHPAGLVGTHINRLCPVGAANHEAWHLSYQDVISIGHLMQKGIPWFERIVSLAGSAIKQPRLLRIPLGASIKTIVDNENLTGSVNIIAGSPLYGNIAQSADSFLGQHQYQITVNTCEQEKELTYELYSGNGTQALIPTTNLDALAPNGILAVPMLRALLVGDIDRARELGALELVEEDMALLSYASTTNADYGSLLRSALNQYVKEGLIIL